MSLPFKSGSVRPRCFHFAIVQELFRDICHWTWLFSALSCSSCLLSLLRSFEKDGEAYRQLQIGLFDFQFKIGVFQRKEGLALITAYCLEFQYSLKKYLRSTSCEPGTEVTYVFTCPRVMSYEEDINMGVMRKGYGKHRGLLKHWGTFHFMLKGVFSFLNGWPNPRKKSESYPWKWRG